MLIILGVLLMASACVLVSFSCFVVGARYDEANERQRRAQLAAQAVRKTHAKQDVSKT